MESLFSALFASLVVLKKLDVISCDWFFVFIPAIIAILAYFSKAESVMILKRQIDINKSPLHDVIPSIKELKSLITETKSNCKLSIEDSDKLDNIMKDLNDSISEFATSKQDIIISFLENYLNLSKEASSILNKYIK